MLFEGIIITGTSCAGKSTIAKKLCELVANNGARFEQVKAVTTRGRRADDSNYEYIKDEEFDELLSDEKLLVDSVYRDKKYGIKKDEYDEARIVPYFGSFSVSFPSSGVGNRFISSASSLRS